MRPNWVVVGPELFNKYGAGGPPKAESRWKQPSKLHLKDAIAEYGDHEVPGWNGSERAARAGLRPPEPPWMHYGSEAQLPKLLTFDASGNNVYLEEEAAKEWWRSIEGDLVAEWRAEQTAVSRWRAAVDGLRSILADDHLKAELLTDTGDIQEVPLEKWRARDAGAILETGFAKFHVWHGYTSANYEGVVLIDRNALAQVLSGENVGQGIASPSSIDPELHPYLALMLKAAGELPFSKVDRLPKKEIEAWLRAKWPTDLGQPTDNKIESMATFLRRPEDEGGGNLPSKRNKSSSRRSRISRDIAPSSVMNGCPTPTASAS